MSAHTKGLWIAVEARHREIEITTQARIDSSQGSICEMDIDFDGAHGVEQTANARLIAAAPEMHAALEAHSAWAYAERNNIGSFQQKMRLCEYAEWLTDKALGHTSVAYKGVPRMVINGGAHIERDTEIDAQFLVAEVQKARAAIAKSQS